MSSRPLLRPEQVILNGDMSAVSIISKPTIIQMMSQVGYSVSWSGTSPVGSVSVQVSNDYSLNSTGEVNNAGTWSTLTLSLNGSPVDSVPVAGNTGNGFIDVTATGAYAIRLVYTKDSGTGSFQAIVAGKVA